MDIIKALKENEKPFGLMSEEMQAKAKEIRLANPDCTSFNVYGSVWVSYSNINKPSNSNVIRLRPDYEESGVVEFRIWRDTDCLVYDRNESISGLPIERAVSDPDFIGFKYENGFVYVSPRLYIADGKSFAMKGSNRSYMEPDTIETFKVLTPTHVLFRRSK